VVCPVCQCSEYVEKEPDDSYLSKWDYRNTSVIIRTRHLKITVVDSGNEQRGNNKKMSDQKSIDNFVEAHNRISDMFPKTAEAVIKNNYLCGYIKVGKDYGVVVDFTKENNFSNYQKQGKQIIDSYKSMMPYFK